MLVAEVIIYLLLEHFENSQKLSHKKTIYHHHHHHHHHHCQGS